MTVGKLEPYWYILPSDLQQYRSLFCFVGAKDKITVSDVLFILETMSSSPNCNISFQQQFEVVNKVLKWLCNFTENEIKRIYDKMFVPVSTGDKNKLVLKPARQVAFLDSDLNWVGNDSDDLGDILEDYFLVHPSISYDMCCKLQLKPLNTMVANTEEFCFEHAGQSEPLTTRLNRILREYKDTSVIQELLQNADDAGATEVAIYYDTREHDSSHLFFPGMANSYGPALLFYNNAEFAAEDFENIRKIAGETKINKPLKIGKYGVGFCSVYHITDVPSFVSGECLVVFDPTLQCLKKEIKSELNPGVKINFNKHRLMKKSNQLAPYTGISGFNPKAPFHGTLFRFPLRSKGSKVSGNVYTESMLLNMMEQVKKNSSKLLMFLNNVKKISFHRSQGGSFTKYFEISTTKHKVPNNNDVVMCKVQVTTMSPSNQNKEENWLIASKAQQLQQNHGTSSVSVKLELNSSLNQFCVAAVKGECFCFLPLNIETGLPVHVSSNFAVMTNRRGIWKADSVFTATKESNWNKALMESVVVQSYLMLLLHLQQMQQNGLLVAYTFHSLWPVTLREVNPWDCFVDKFYSGVLSSQHPLFCSDITTRWQRFNECKFLSNKILAIGFDNKSQSSVYHVATVLKLPVVNLPSILWNKLEMYGNFASQILDEEQFIKYFYNDETLSKVFAQEKAEIIAASLIVYANNRHSKAMPDLMKNTKCIPCSPDGIKFKYPHDILHPDSNLSILFLPENSVFPYKAFLNRNSLILTALGKLGLMQSLSWQLIVDRAKCVHNWHNENSKEALNRLVILLDCIRDNSSAEMPDRQIQQELQRIAFLPVMSKPKDYPTVWKGDTVASLLSGPELIKVSQGVTSVNAVYACGSQVAILDTQFLPQQSHNLTNKMLKVLGIKQEIEITNVINHFKELLEWFKNCEIEKDILGVTNTITNSVYQYLARKINTNSSDEVLLNGISSLTDKHCIWNSKKFLLPVHVSFNWTIDGPYLYKLPDALKQFTLLMEQLGIKCVFPANVMLDALGEMKNDFDNTSLPVECQAVVRLILPQLIDCVLPEDADIFLPDVNFILRNVKELKYNDAPWCTADEEFMYCHVCVERNIAIHLGVEPVKSVLLDDLHITSDELGTEFGQVEELTQRLNNILRDYPRDMTFLKELLQNADDAGATKLYFILDKRTHEKAKVISEEWKALQGPALLFWNNSPFTDEDLVGIQKIGLCNKRVDPDKISQYGIGFNVVYHFTDCPSFIANDQLCIMDPHYRYIARKRMKPGRMYKGLEKLWKMFPHMESPYLRNDLDEFPEDMKGGSLFRLPLRLKQEDAKQSKIVADDGYFNLSKLEKDLADWVPKMKEALLFIHHVCDIRLYVIEDKKSVGVFHWDDPHPVVLRSHIESNKGREKEIMKDGNAKLVVYNMRLANKQTDPPQEEKWLIQLGEGRADDSSFDWKDIKPEDIEIRPQHGIAALLDNKHFYGKSFCYLPLPGGTKLPVHVHGQFVLHSDRRGLRIISNDDPTTATDKKGAWNKHLIEAISISYATLLTHIISHDGPPCDREMSLQSLKQYYRLFPSIAETTTEPWKSLAIGVYEQLSILNPPILATLVKSDLWEDENNLQEGEENQLYVIKWCNLHLPQQSNEGYFHEFHSYQSNVYSALKTIGMNLVDTPREIYCQFNAVGIVLPDISKESVLAYYIRFHDEIFNHENLPCPISSTRFGNAKCFIHFVKYLSLNSVDTLVDDTNTSIAQLYSDTCFIQNLQEIGCLMTINENVHCISDNKRIINSNSWKLFPNSGDIFMHTDLMEYTGSHSIFHLKESDVCYNLIHSVFAANLPSSWCEAAHAPLGDVDISWVDKLLKCLSEDPVFKPHCSQVLKHFTLIPSDNGVMYSTTSELLPMKLKSPHENKIESLLRKFKVCFLNTATVVESVLVDINVTLPELSKPRDVLKSVYLANKDCLDQLQDLSGKELTMLFDIFKLISYSSSKQAKPYALYLRTLPIFKTINGKLVQLSSISTIWIWNELVSKVGIVDWINHVPTSVLFLDPAAPWKVLQSQAEILGIKSISAYKLYTSYIFPHFNLMNSVMRTDHIKNISLKIFPSCKNHSSDSKSQYHGDAMNFVSKIRSLKCIGNDNLALRSINSFYDHTEEVFNLYYGDESFLPKALQGCEILECLKYFGLKTLNQKHLSSDDYIQFCYQLTKIRDAQTVLKASSALIQCIFQNESNYQHLQTQSFLQKISTIAIAVVKVMPKLNAIKSQKLGEFMIDETDTVTLTKLSGSCLYSNNNAYSVWTCKPLVELPVNLHDIKDVAKLKALGVSVMPQIEDVVENFKNLSKSEFSDYLIFNKKTPLPRAKLSVDLPNLFLKMMECIDENIRKYKQKSGGKYDYEHLELEMEDLSIIPVKLQTPNCGYGLVKPFQVLVMSESQLNIFYPFLHPLIKVVPQPVLQLLTEIGVKRSLDISAMQIVLRLAKEVFNENKIDHITKQTVAKATVQLTTSLRNAESKSVTLKPPLYLLNDQDILTDSSQLVVFDINSVHHPVLPPQFSYLNSLPSIPEAMHWKPKEMWELLPKKFGLKSLNSIIQYKIIDVTPVHIAHPHVAVIEQILRSRKFKLAIQSYANYCTRTPDSVENVKKIITNFQNKLKVQYLHEIELQLTLNLDNEVVTLQNTVSHDFHFECCNDEFTLSLVNSSSMFLLQTFQQLSETFCALLELQETNCFKVADEALISYVYKLLSCGSVSNINDIMRKSMPGFQHEVVDLEPVLGEVIPECWHHRLDQNIFNYFTPQELVGYETETNDIIYAQVLYCNNGEAYDNKENIEQMFELKYTTTIGNDTKLVLQLYKLVSAIQGANSVAESHEINDSINHKQACQSRKESSREAIRNAIKFIWSIPERYKQKAIKRIYLQYHPKKNPDNLNALVDFQFLLQELERVEKQQSSIPTSAEQSIRDSSFFNSKWSGWLKQ